MKHRAAVSCPTTVIVVCHCTTCQAVSTGACRLNVGVRCRHNFCHAVGAEHAHDAEALPDAHLRAGIHRGGAVWCCSHHIHRPRRRGQRHGTHSCKFVSRTLCCIALDHVLRAANSAALQSPTLSTADLTIVEHSAVAPTHSLIMVTRVLLWLQACHSITIAIACWPVASMCAEG